MDKPNKNQEEKKEKKGKIYSLSNDEKAELTIRRAEYQREAYKRDLLLKAIDEDFHTYLNNVVKKRLGIPEKQEVILNLNEGSLILKEMEKTEKIENKEVKK